MPRHRARTATRPVVVVLSSCVQASVDLRRDFGEVLRHPPVPIRELEVFESDVQPSALIAHPFVYVAGGPHPDSVRARLHELLDGWQSGFRWMMEECERMRRFVEPRQERLARALEELGHLHHQLYLPTDAPIFRALLNDVRPTEEALSGFDRHIEEVDVDDRAKVLAADPFYSLLLPSR